MKATTDLTKAIQTIPAMSRGWLLALVRFSLPAFLALLVLAPSSRAGGGFKAIFEKMQQYYSGPSWVRKSTQEISVGLDRYRITFEARFQQTPSYSGLVNTTFDLVLTKVEKRVFWSWSNLPVLYSSCSATGSFSGPYSPTDGSGNSGYYQPNPFSNVVLGFSQSHLGQLRHFKDTRVGGSFRMTHGLYSVTWWTSGGAPVTGTMAW